MQTFIRVRVIDTDIGIEEGPRMRPLFFGPCIVTSLFEWQPLMTTLLKASSLLTGIYNNITQDYCKLFKGSHILVCVQHSIKKTWSLNLLTVKNKTNSSQRKYIYAVYEKRCFVSCLKHLLIYYEKLINLYILMTSQISKA